MYEYLAGFNNLFMLDQIKTEEPNTSEYLLL